MRTRLLICLSFLFGAGLALVVEHVGRQSAWRTLAFLGISVVIGWFGRLGFERPRQRDGDPWGGPLHTGIREDLEEGLYLLEPSDVPVNERPWWRRAP